MFEALLVEIVRACQDVSEFSGLQWLEADRARHARPRICGLLHPLEDVGGKAAPNITIIQREEALVHPARQLVVIVVVPRLSPVLGAVVIGVGPVPKYVPK